jgi:hypothetical protein
MSATVTAAAQSLQLSRREPAAGRAPAADRPTPQTTVEAVMYTVRERSLKALLEPANQQRLSRCDAGARTQINARIEKLLAANLIWGEAKRDV